VNNTADNENTNTSMSAVKSILPTGKRWQLRHTVPECGMFDAVDITFVFIDFARGFFAV
jgi:hypothetical protein